MTRSRRLILTSIVPVSLLAAGCGGGGASTTAAFASNTLLAYSHCMRGHGVSSFPDPDRSGGIDKDKIIAAAGSPHFTQASSACLHLMPRDGLGPPPTARQTRTRLADALSFANCMRSHGVTRFPDPTAQGALSVAMVQAQGVDLRSPAVLATVRTCLPASHGALTAANVREALSSAGG